MISKGGAGGGGGERVGGITDVCLMYGKFNYEQPTVGVKRLIYSFLHKFT